MNHRERPHDAADYRKRRALLMASITPTTRCGRCGRLFHEHPRHKNGRPGRWEVGHVLDGDNRGPLRIEHSVCNRVAGGRLGYKRGIGKRMADDRYGGADAHYPGHYDLEDPTSIGAPPCVEVTGQLCPTCRWWRRKYPHGG